MSTFVKKNLELLQEILLFLSAEPPVQKEPVNKRMYVSVQ